MDEIKQLIESKDPVNWKLVNVLMVNYDFDSKWIISNLMNNEMDELLPSAVHQGCPDSMILWNELYVIREYFNLNVL